MTLEINNLTDEKITEKPLALFFKKVAKHLQLKDKTISLAFVLPREMRRLNRVYRHRDKATDVLSFTLAEKRGKLLGEVVICPLVARAKAKKLGISSDFQMKRLFLHGLLHCLDYDHEKSEREAEKMEQLERELLRL